ncbi:MAG: hypothetical protein WCD42_08755 [Rhizomicrobium sp.]
MRKIFLAALLFAVLPAQGAERICIDLGQQGHFDAKIIDEKTFLLQNASDKTQAALQVTTSCMGLQPTDKIGMPSAANCVSVGETIEAKPAKGEPQVCTVVRVKRAEH